MGNIIQGLLAIKWHLYRFISIFISLLFIVISSANASKAIDKLDTVIHSVNQKCNSMDISAFQEDINNTISVDREYLRASILMSIDADCKCLPDKLKTIRIKYNDSLQIKELDDLLRNSQIRCLTKSLRNHMESLCKASILNVTNDQSKINEACKCIVSTWNKASDEEIKTTSINAYNIFINNIENNTKKPANHYSEIDHCIDNANIDKHSQYTKEREALRKNETIRRQVDSKLRILRAKLNLYRLDHGKYPSNTDGIGILMKQTVSPFTNKMVGPYLDEVPVDGWGNEIMYTFSESAGGFSVTSFGRDGKLGGLGLDQDITLKSGE